MAFRAEARPPRHGARGRALADSTADFAFVAPRCPVQKRGKQIFASCHYTFDALPHDDVPCDGKFSPASRDAFCHAAALERTDKPISRDAIAGALLAVSSPTRRERGDYQRRSLKCTLRRPGLPMLIAAAPHADDAKAQQEKMSSDSSPAAPPFPPASRQSPCRLRATMLVGKPTGFSQ